MYCKSEHITVTDQRAYLGLIVGHGEIKVQTTFTVFSNFMLRKQCLGAFTSAVS